MCDLEGLVGGAARLWDFSPSHDRLVIQVVGLDGRVQYLVLSGCDAVATPVCWRFASPRFEAVVPPFLELVDGEVRVRCQEASIQSDYERGR